MQDRVLRCLEGSQKLLVRQVDRSLANTIDQYRMRQEERKNGQHGGSNTANGANGQSQSDEDSDPGKGAASSYVQVMAEFKKALLNTKLNKKNFAQMAGQSVKHLKPTIFKLKTGLQVKPDQDTLIVKTNVFDVPREVWRSGFNAFQMDN